MPKTVWITGADGYIGGQCMLEFEDAGYTVIGLDTSIGHGYKLDYGSPDVVDFLLGDKPDIIVHCAATSLVGPSMQDPAKYYLNNVASTINFLEAIRHSVPDTHFIFASSAAVYGQPIDIDSAGIKEDNETVPISPYGTSKLIVEKILQDYQNIYGMKTTSLRFFNVCGADPQGRHGQLNDASHIMPRIISAIKNNQPVKINGTDYNTKDGTCVRDYVHVCDVTKAIRMCAEQNCTGTYNIGNYNLSVKEIVKHFEDALEKSIDVELHSRRQGDPDFLVADNSKLKQTLNWNPTYDPKAMVTTAWQWHSNTTSKA